MIRITWYIVFLCLLLWLGGCGDSSSRTPDPWAELEDLDVNLCIQVNVSDAAGTGASTTRSLKGTRDITVGDVTLPTQDASAFENIHTLRVIIVRPDNTVEHNVMESLPALESVENFKELMFKVSTSQGKPDPIDPDIRIERKRIYLIANEASIQPKELREKFEKLQPGDKLPPSGTNGEGAPLDLMYKTWPDIGPAEPMIDNENVEADQRQFVPMTEFFDVDVKFDITKGASHRVQAETLFITRTLVKFEFTVRGTQSDHFRISKIEFGNVMEKEYLFPCQTVYFPAKSDRNAMERAITSFKTPGSSDNTVRRYDFSPGSFEWDGKKDWKGWIKDQTVPTYSPKIYFCETQNYTGKDVGGNETVEEYHISVSAEILDNKNPVQTVVFETKKLPNLPALPRNTIVRINLIFTGRDLDFEVDLVPYIGCYLDPWFGLDPNRPAS